MKTAIRLFSFVQSIFGSAHGRVPEPTGRNSTAESKPDCIPQVPTPPMETRPSPSEFLLEETVDMGWYDE